ncbi:MAG TPA: YdcF family protein, partial [Stellaceae bacterium]
GRTRRFRRRRLLLVPLVGLLLAAALWSGGLVWFAGAIPRTVADADTPTDAVVVLTGGRQRLESGLQLIADGKAQKLLISGVNPSVDLHELLRVSSPHMPEWVACCIVLGYEAGNTVGNAHETAAWMRREGYGSLRLVTAAYHMPRSLLELRRALPGVTIIPHPVFPEKVMQARWWAWPGTLSLIVGEYHKYLGALFRPWIRVGRRVIA